MLNLNALTLPVYIIALCALLACMLSFAIILYVWQKNIPFKKGYITCAWSIQLLSAWLFVIAFNWEFGLSYYFITFSLMALGLNLFYTMLTLCDTHIFSPSRQQQTQQVNYTAHLSPLFFSNIKKKCHPLFSHRAVQYVYSFDWIPSFKSILGAITASLVYFWRFFSVIPLALITAGLLLTFIYNILPFNLHTRVAVVTFLYPVVLMIIVFYQCFTSQRRMSDSVFLGVSALSGAYLFI